MQGTHVRLPATVAVSLVVPTELKQGKCTPPNLFVKLHVLVLFRRRDSVEMPLSVRAAVTRYRRLGSLSNKHLLFIVLEAGKFKIKVPAASVSGESPLPVLSVCFLTVSSRGGRSEEALWNLLLAL